MKQPYKTHVLSRYDYPTRIVAGSSGRSRGAIISGADTALTALQAKIGRPIKDNFVPKHTKGQWRWREYPEDSPELAKILEELQRKELKQKERRERYGQRKR